LQVVSVYACQILHFPVIYPVDVVAGSAKGADIVLEAVVEAEVARNAKDFFSQPQNQIQ